jgi:hypothetical protein
MTSLLPGELQFYSTPFYKPFLLDTQSACFYDSPIKTGILTILSRFFPIILPLYHPIK